MLVLAGTSAFNSLCPEDVTVGQKVMPPKAFSFFLQSECWSSIWLGFHVHEPEDTSSYSKELSSAVKMDLGLPLVTWSLLESELMDFLVNLQDFI